MLTSVLKEPKRIKIFIKILSKKKFTLSYNLGKKYFLLLSIYYNKTLSILGFNEKWIHHLSLS